MPLQGAIVVCYGWGAEGDDQFWWSGRGAIAGCHCSVLWLRGRVTTNFGGVVVVPLQGAIVMCYGWGAEGDDQFWWSGRGAIAGCHCSVLWLRGRVTTNFGGADVVPLLGAIVVCYGGGGGLRPTLGEWM